MFSKHLEEIEAITASQTTQTSQLIPSTTPTTIEKPSAWMREGTSPTEIIIAVAILTSLTIGGISSVIVAIAALVKTLIPQRQEDKPKTPSGNNKMNRY